MPGASITLMRKDGRPLVTEFPVTAEDMIEYHPPCDGPYPIPAGAIACSFGSVVVDRTAWMDADIDHDDEELWIP
ncbi:hypothetical protein ACTJI8_12695 [Microbacterium sp. 22303]|uniref:hypothetical protein n=1 Tax=Microbacterium sp. 22303 TaxID=3453905 RepID=UPI003F86742B